MVQNFSNLSAHRTYALSLFRLTLRNANYHSHSIHFRDRIRRVVRKLIWKHRGDRSSWSVYFLLEKMRVLNEHLVNGETLVVWSMLSSFTKQEKSLIGSSLIKASKHAEEASRVKLATNIRELKEDIILTQYINRRTENNQLPRDIPEVYKLKLLKPLALHENALMKLLRIQHQLSKGPPSVVLSHTSAGSARIWFLRSALNKGKRQSKALGIVLRKEKKEAQKRLESLRNCWKNAAWALEEAAWEQMLEDGSFLNRDLGKHLDILSASTKSDQHNNEIEAPKSPSTVKEWLGPIQETMQALTEAQQERIKYYKDFKDSHLVNSGQIGFWQQKSQLMHAARVGRFRRLLEKDLPQVTPFLEGRDLPSLLSKYNLK